MAVKALAEAKQITILRKGGIDREDREFRLEHPEFLLYPTYEHQSEDLTKVAYHQDIAATVEENDVPGLVTLGSWGQVTDVLEITDQTALDTLSPFHIWTGEYVSKRLHWRPKDPLRVALLRVYTLQQPQALPVLDEYGGCKSWVDLGQDVPLGYMSPVLSDEDFQERVGAIKRAVNGA